MSRKTLAITAFVAVILTIMAIALKRYSGTIGSPGGILTHVSIRLPIPIIEAGSTPFFVAQDKGFYKDEGLDVSIEMGSPELNPVKTVSVGTDDFGVLGGPDTLLVARSKGQELKAISILHRNSNFPVLI